MGRSKAVRGGGASVVKERDGASEFVVVGWLSLSLLLAGCRCCWAGSWSLLSIVVVVEVEEEGRRGEVGGEVAARCLFGGSVWSSWKRGEGSWLVVRGEARANGAERTCREQSWSDDRGCAAARLGAILDATRLKPAAHGTQGSLLSFISFWVFICASVCVVRPCP